VRLLEYGALALILSLTGMEPLQQPSGCRTTIEDYWYGATPGPLLCYFCYLAYPL